MPKVKRLSRVIGVSDLQRAKHFYQSALGLEATFETEHWIDLNCGDGSLALSPNYGHRPAGDQGIDQTKIIFDVEGIDELVARFEELGGKVVHVSDHAGSPVRVVHICDLDQNVFQLSEMREPGPSSR